MGGVFAYRSMDSYNEAHPGGIQRKTQKKTIPNFEFEKQRAEDSRQEAEVDENYKSQNPNNKQITITEIQNPKPSQHLQEKRTPNMFGSLRMIF
jgi:FtsZ-interacting cell division protein ZipA